MYYININFVGKIVDVVVERVSTAVVLLPESHVAVKSLVDGVAYQTDYRNLVLISKKKARKLCVLLY